MKYLVFVLLSGIFLMLSALVLHAGAGDTSEIVTAPHLFSEEELATPTAVAVDSHPFSWQNIYPALVALITLVLTYVSHRVKFLNKFLTRPVITATAIALISTVGFYFFDRPIAGDEVKNLLQMFFGGVGVSGYLYEAVFKNNIGQTAQT
jgi:cellulose synthase/poly-beta-1,6-N-acetylglucosamine synthase-like glycosyltransferase